MNKRHEPHSLEDMGGGPDNFQIWPFTRDTGCPVSDIRKPHLHDFYVIQYVARGSGTHVIDFQPYEISPHSLYFVSPRQLHIWNPEGALEGFVMVFTEEFLRFPESPFPSIYELDFFHSLASSPVKSLSEAEGGMLSEMMDKMSAEFMDKNPGYHSVLRALFHVFIVNVRRLAAGGTAANRAEPGLVRRFQRMVSENSTRQMSVADYAGALGVSVSKLSAMVKESTGRPPGQIIRNETIIAAKRLLVHSELNVSEICFQLDFEDPSYFGRFFKRETGVTPSAFREHMHKKYDQFSQ